MENEGRSFPKNKNKNKKEQKKHVNMIFPASVLENWSFQKICT